MTKVHQIRREFGEPFRDVVTGFASMGYSRRATAEILEINLSYFRTCLLPRHAPGAPWKERRDLRDECKPRPSSGGWPKGKKRDKPVRYSDEYLLALIRRHHDLTYHQFGNLAPVAASTIARRFGTWNKAREKAATFHSDNLKAVP